MSKLQNSDFSQLRQPTGQARYTVLSGAAQGALGHQGNRAATLCQHTHCSQGWALAPAHLTCARRHSQHTLQGQHPTPGGGARAPEEQKAASQC